VSIDVNIENELETAPSGAPPTPRRQPKVERETILLGGFSAVAAVLIVGLCFWLTPLDGQFAWVWCTYGVFVAILWALTRRRVGTLRANDRVATVVVATLGLGVVVPLCLIIGYVTIKGLRGLNAAFFADTMEQVGPLDPASAGGAKHAILGTLIQVGLATLISVPLGVLSAVYLNEVGGRMAKTVRFLVDSMSGIPSIVAGLFIYTIWVVEMGKGFSGLAAAFALSVLMLPTVTRTAEEMLKLVPGGLRESSLALGASEWRTVWRVVLPSAKTGLVTAVILGIARVAGETAPLLMTSFGNDTVNTNPTQGPMSALPLFVYKQIRAPEANQIARAWTGALVLILLVLLLFVIARAIAALGKKV
jgi:phosphate transport system permease protein